MILLMHFFLRFAINKELRSGKKSKYREPNEKKFFDKIGLNIDDMKDQMELATTKYADTIHKDTLMYRGIHSSFVKKIKVGEILKDKGFSYLTTSLDMANKYKNRKGAILKIIVKNGTKGKWGFKDQHEFILPKDSRLKIVKHEGDTYVAEII